MTDADRSRAYDLEELLQRVAVGDLSPDDERVRAAAARDEEFRIALAELHELEVLATGVRRRRDEDLRAIDDGAVAEESARLVALVQRLASDEGATSDGGSRDDSARRPSAVRFRAGWLVAAAALVALAFFLRGLVPAAGPGSPRDAPLVLGPHLGDLAPSGPGSSYERFSWEAPDAAWFDIEIYDVATGEFIDVERGVEETRWTPSPERHRAWPENIRWVVNAFDLSGALEDSAAASASRSSH